MIDNDTHDTGTFQRLAHVPTQGLSIADLAEILFCSTLQPSQTVDGAAVQAAVSQSLRVHDGGVQACAAELAACYGKDPDVACVRMRWCRDLAARFF